MIIMFLLLFILVIYPSIAGLLIAFDMIVYKKWHVGFDPDRDMDVLLLAAMFWPITMIPIVMYWIAAIALDIKDEEK